MSGLVVVCVTDSTELLQEMTQGADAPRISARRREAVVKQVQVQRQRRQPAPVEIDTRTPSGRVLPF